MGTYNKWRAHIVDLDLLYSAWHEQHRSASRMSTRMREVHTICIFALCVENDNGNRYAVGFQPYDQHKVEEVSVLDLIDEKFRVREDDCDALLIEVPGNGEVQATHHRCQITSFANQRGMSESDWVIFLSKKLRYAPDSDLRLVVHCEQGGPCNHVFLNAYLCHGATRCPYSQVFTIGQLTSDPPSWQCHMVYPSLATLPVLTKARAEQLLGDRPRLNRRSVLTHGQDVASE